MGRRIRLYLLGVLLGTGMVYIFVFRKHDINWLSWLPTDRILRDIGNNEALLKSKGYACFLACRNFPASQMRQVFEHGEFENLRPGGDPYLYEITWSDSNDVPVMARISKTGKLYAMETLQVGADTAACSCP